MSTFSTLQDDLEEEWALTRELVQEAWKSELHAPADGRKARLSAVVKRTGVALRTVQRALSSDPSHPTAPRVGRPSSLTIADKLYLLDLCDEGLCYRDEDYVLRLQHDTGTTCHQKKSSPLGTG